jgi:hypothetical protein
MTAAALQELARELKGPLPSELAGLSDTELSQLTDAVRRLRRQQDSDLAKAMEGALSHVPALLRGAVRKILFS